MKILAVDYGDSRTGLATCDRTEFLTTAITPQITLKARDKVASKVCEVAKDIGAELIVIGLPLNMDGTEGPRAEKCAAFGALLRQATGLEVILWDERRTTIDAHNILFQNGQNAKKRKKTVDAVAAALMLEGYLTRRRLEGAK